MSIESIIPKDEESWLALRTHDITSTDVAALFGISPYLTSFELWHRKKSGSIVTLAVNERMKWGTRLQDAIAEGIAEDQSWIVRRMVEYVRNNILRIGSSFDFSIENVTPPNPELDPLNGLLEIKNVDSLAFKEGWIVEGEDVQAPAHIELQVQHQLLVSGRKEAFIGALVGGNKVVLIRRAPDLSVAEAIIDRVSDFWKSIEAGVAPAPNFQKDSDFIASLYNFAEPGKVFDARGNEHLEALMARYKEAQHLEKGAGMDKDSVKAEILMTIGDCEKVLGDSFTISAGVIGECPVSYLRKAYRGFKPSFKKVK